MIHGQYPLWLIGLVILLTAGCQNVRSDTVSAPSPFSPTSLRPTSSAALTPQASDLQLRLSQTVTAGEVFVLEAANVGQITYVHYGQSNENCLGILDANGNGLRITPDLTCDALEEKVIQPGKRVFISTWDLKRCIDNDCLIREPVAPGAYGVAETFYPFFAEDGSFDVENAVTAEATFSVLPADS